MPQILVIADAPADDGEAPVMFRERVSVEDFESRHFASQILERLGWAVGDADQHDRHARRTRERREARRRVIDAAQREMRMRAAGGQRRSAKLVTSAS